MPPIKVNMPDFLNGFPAYYTYFDVRRNNKEALDQECELSSIFGCFPNCIWMGGGHYHSTTAFYLTPNIEKCLEFYNSNGIPIRFTFTNPLLTREMFNDHYGHTIMQIASNGMNEVITSVPDFEKYLQDKYPNFKYIRSIIGTKDTPVQVDDSIYLAVLRRQMNNNWDYLDKIDPKIREKIELLCNDPCNNNCPRIYSHYRDHARRQLSFGDTRIRAECTFRMCKTQFLDKDAASLPTTITKEMALEIYKPKGFINFKISGRFNTGSIIEDMAEWFILPEYRKDYRANSINTLCKLNSERVIF